MTTTVNINGSLRDLDDAWDRWMEKVPDEEREAVATIIADADLSTLTGINRLSQVMVVELIRGHVSPVVAQAAKPWIELMIFNIQSMHAAAGTKQGSVTADAIALLLELRNKKPLRAEYTTRELPDLEVEVEPADHEAPKLRRIEDGGGDAVG